MVHPHPGVAVGLQLQPYAAGLGPGLTGALRLHLAHRPGQVLDVVAELVREHVRLRGVATLGTQLAGQLVEEAGVQVDRGVPRAVEGADRRGRRAAGGRHLAGERDHLDLLVAVVGARPVGLDGVRVRDEPALAVARRCRRPWCTAGTARRPCPTAAAWGSEVPPIRSPGLIPRNRASTSTISPAPPPRAILPPLPPREPPICEGSSWALSRYLTMSPPCSLLAVRAARVWGA